MSIATTAPTFNPHDPKFLEDPYPQYAQFRAEEPIKWVDKPYDSYWVFRHDHAMQVLRDKDTFVKQSPIATMPTPDELKKAGAFIAMGYLPKGLFPSDPPRHTALRPIMEQAFVEPFRAAPKFAAAVANDPLAKIKVGGERFELVSDYAIALPSAVLFHVLGLPKEHGLTLIGWVDAVVMAHDETQNPRIRAMGATCRMALLTYYQGLVKALEAGQPVTGDGVVKTLAAQVGTTLSDGTKLTTEDVAVCCADFTVAGYISTTYLIGTGIRNLLNNPDQLALLAEEPGKHIKGAVEEMLRYDAPAQLVDRVVKTDGTKLGDVVFKAGDAITVVIGSAGRDEEAFPKADKFIIDRDHSKQIGFGYGIHECIGAALVRGVAPVAIESLLKELPGLKLAGKAQWQTDPYLRAMTNLPLAFRMP